MAITGINGAAEVMYASGRTAKKSPCTDFGERAGQTPRTDFGERAGQTPCTDFGEQIGRAAGADFDRRTAGEEKKEEKKKSDTHIITKPDGSRYLVVTENIGGMKVTAMSIKLSDIPMMSERPDVAGEREIQAQTLQGEETGI